MANFINSQWQMCPQLRPLRAHRHHGLTFTKWPGIGAQKWFRKCKYMNHNGEISWATSWMENKHEMHPLLVTYCHVKKENEEQNAYTFQPLCGCCASMRFISFSQICSRMAGSLSLVGLLWLVSSMRTTRYWKCV